MIFGPDGRFYFNSGNQPWDVTDRSGRRSEMNATSGFFEGAAMRVNPDGTDLQVLAHNFRNPYELVVDSFGTIFQTDNDDDGNAWTRLNYVMEGGNFGFRGPLHRTWTEDRSSHFHNELPGIVPNIARLGAGSPTGLIVYEGSLLPEKYRGQLLHAEAGKRLIPAYLQSDDGAGYSTRVEEVLYAATDTWFRPADISVAPDGAVYVADWYDPGVGGHGMGDPQGARGRIYRLAPPNHKTNTPRLDLESAAGLTEAFGSPNQSVYYLAMILDRAEKGAWPPELKVLATGLVNGTAGGRGFGGGRGATPPDPAVMAAIRARAANVLPPIVGATAAPIPSLRILDRDFPPNVVAGRRVFEAEGTCSACHSLGGPKLVGPDLSATGDKFGKQGLLDASINPSEAIAPEYQVWNLKTTTQGDVTGILIEDTPERVVVNTGAGDPIRLKPSETARTQSRVSIMPEGLLNKLSPQQIADLLEYLTTLKAKK